MGKKRATMKDVAREAGVSAATVSAVLNKRNTQIPVSERTRKKVLNAARAMNYHLDEQARALRQGKSNTIGVVVSDITQPLYGMMLRMVEQEVRQKNYHFLVSDIEITPEKEKSYLDLFMRRNVDGILFLGGAGDIDDADILNLVENGVAVVLAEREVGQGRVPCALADNIKGGFLATDHLIRHGHRRVGCLRTSTTSAVSMEREAGYRQALESHGIEYSQELIAGDGNTLEDGHRAVTELFERTEVPKALFAQSDLVALGAMRAIRDKGLSVPEDIALAGFDDIPIAAYVEPPLTTVHQPVQRMCRNAVQTLLDILEDNLPRDFAKRTVFEPELVIRSSCGCSPEPVR